MVTTSARTRALALTLLAGLFLGCGGDGGGGGGWKPGQPLTLDVSGAFPAGTVVRDASSGATATVAGDGKVTLTPDASGLVLLEKDGAAPTPFRWDAATIYFAMTDRFANGDPSNDESYGRWKDGAQEVGTWHGGDLAGLTAHLDHIQALGADAIWISPPVEQVHGWVAGGTGDFKHWGYHGYWALDFTKLDANFGTEADLKAFVDAAHARGIRVLFDVVMNHPGYATGADLEAYLPEVFDATGFHAWEATATGSYGDWNNFVNYNTDLWLNWWGPKWVRAGFPFYPAPGTDDLTKQLAYLPDFLTEKSTEALLPPLLGRKTDTAAVYVPGATVRQYLVAWHTDWVRRFGIDGFRCDTAKHVEQASWRALKEAGVAALDAWRAANPDAPKPPGDVPFYTVGEVFPHGVTKDAYFSEGKFDSVLNFEFQPSIARILTNEDTLLARVDDLDTLYATMAEKLVPDPAFDVTSYLSSHDTKLFYDTVGDDPAKMRQAGTALLLVPGSAQIFYGDESGRLLGPGLSEPTQGTRSDMNWDSIDASILDAFRKVGTFRKRHGAVGAGVHARITSPTGTYAFSRVLGTDDAVVVVMTPPAG